MYERPTYTELLELAHICFKQSEVSTTPDVRTELRIMGGEYERRATGLKHQQSPDSYEGFCMGSPSIRLTRPTAQGDGQIR